MKLCEDIGAKPVPVINCGMSCQFRGNTPVEMKDLDPWVQDALDLVEFANGPVDSRWGALRASMGHPEPFNLKRLGIGNEQWGEVFFERYAVFAKALAARYPDLLLVSTAGAGVDDGNWNLAWGKFKSGEAPAHIVDEHYYRPLDWFLDQSSRYDSYDRSWRKQVTAAYDFGDVQVLGSYGQNSASEPRLRKARADGGIWGCSRITIGCDRLFPADTDVNSALAKIVWTPDGEHTIKLTGEVFKRDTSVQQLYDMSAAMLGYNNESYIRDLEMSRKRIALG